MNTLERATLPAVSPSLALLVLTTLVGCSSTAKIASTNPQQPMVIDGRLNDWPTNRALIDDKRLSVGFRNDDQFLYVSIATSDRPIIRSIMMGGLTVWLDPKGGKDRSFGVRYPLGFSPGEGMSRDRDNGEGRRERGAFFAASAGDEFEIVGRDDYEASYHKGSVPGIAVQVEMDQGTFTYELKVPLDTTDTMFEAINVGSNHMLGVDLQTRQLMRRGEMGGDESGEGRGGGMGDGGFGGERGGMGGGRFGGGRRGGFGGREGGHGRFRPEPLDQWVEVTLSS